MIAFLIGYILWTMSCAVYETVCLGMAWGSPWIHGPALVFALGSFAYALLAYHHYRSNDQAHGRAIARPVERLVVPDSEPETAPKKKLKKMI